MFTLDKITFNNNTFEWKAFFTGTANSVQTEIPVTQDISIELLYGLKYSYIVGFNNSTNTTVFTPKLN